MIPDFIQNSDCETGTGRCRRHRFAGNCFTSRSICRLMLLVVAAWTGLASPAVWSQMQGRHHLDHYQMPPGEIAWQKTLMRPIDPAWFQPVDLIVPEGAQVAVYTNGAFEPLTNEKALAGMVVGKVYRLRITGIPGHEGREVYPSLEILGRLFPPEGVATQTPIPLNIPLDDIEPALDGSLVTRVVYLENPRTAIPERRRPREQPFMDVGPGDDPLRAAERYGRPLLIARTGSRIPEKDELEGFGFGAPPLHWFEAASISVPGRMEDLGPSTLEPESGVARPLGRQQLSGVHYDPAVRQTAWQEPVVVPAQDPASPPGATGFPGDQGFVTGPVCPPSPLTPAMNQGLVPGMIANRPWQDEYLFDGGDRDLGAVVRMREGTWHVQGLDTEDTIGHFDTLDGEHIVDTSNRVLIYSPRFAAIRKVDGVGRTSFALETGNLGHETATAIRRGRDFSATKLQNVQTKSNRSAMQPRGVEDATRGVLIDNTTQLNAAISAFKTWEDLRLMRTGRYDSSEKGRLAIAISRANTWESDVSAQTADGKMQLVIAEDVAAAQEAVHVHRDASLPKLRIVKIASRDVARPGDEVEFTIRFDNVGDQPIGNVSIVDNLTSRLEYLEGTAECSIPAAFSSKANLAGSSILTWDIHDPMKIGDGGIIRFRCIVR